MIDGGSETGISARSQRNDERDAADQPTECEDRLVARSSVDEIVVVREPGERAALTSGDEIAEVAPNGPSDGRGARFENHPGSWCARPQKDRLRAS